MPTPPELITALSRSTDPDALVLLHMAKVGADLRKPHEPDFAFDVPNKESAEALAQDLCQLDYEVQLYEPDDENPEYKVVAMTTMVLDLGVLNQLSSKFESLAEKYGASYDGWGAEVVA
ncbi:ribonuclease E inhibitor RraB [Aquabacterium sp. G14]|uniref:ribonuclease E inhibitor RraB n=1 Tax=Aquabacterium sp. G14 TaxID=3130164 RepID=UPI0030AFE645